MGENRDLMRPLARPRVSRRRPGPGAPRIGPLRWGGAAPAGRPAEFVSRKKTEKTRFVGPRRKIPCALVPRPGRIASERAIRGPGEVPRGLTRLAKRIPPRRIKFDYRSIEVSLDALQCAHLAEIDRRRLA